MNPTDKGPPQAKPIEPPQAYPEILGELLTLLAAELRSAGLDVTSSNDIAWRTTEVVRDRWGGQGIYIPQAVSFDTLQRYRAIWDAFTGQNVSDLARQFDLSEQAVYKAIRYMREETKRLNQLCLDLGEAGPANNQDQPTRSNP